MLSFVSRSELEDYIRNYLISTSEACELLGCTRQNLDYHIKRGVLMPVKETSRERLFWKEDVERFIKK